MTDCWHIRGGRIIDPSTGRDEIGDVWIAGGTIVPPGSVPARALDAIGCLVVPGLVDLHVHLREPGGEESETVESGAAAAAAGGFSAIVAMPNTHPPTDTPDRVAWLLHRGEACRGARVLPSACITTGRNGRSLADLRKLAAAGAVAFTDDGSTVLDEELMRQAMQIARELGVTVMDHALDHTMAPGGSMHEGEWSKRWGVPGIPSRAESAIVARDVRLAEETGCRVHIQHVSARESLELIRAARARGLPVSAEVTPHHLTLTDADVDGRNTAFKVSPPLRSDGDREALIEAVIDGTVQAFATDHAPHSAGSKAKPFAEAPFGLIGLETAVGVTWTALVASGRMAVPEWVRRWTVGPALVLGLPVPRLTPGAAADVTIIDPEAEWTVRSEAFLSRSRNTPFEGWRLRGRPVCTLCRGTLLWRAPSCRDAVDRGA